MAIKPAIWPVLLANILIPISILIFSLGFFPYKPLIPGLATFEEARNAPAPIFNKVVFMVVDALRSDFVYSDKSGFLFTQGLIRSGAAVPFTAYAGSPTVTMPRLKALTTGSVPSFLDVILNIAESDTSSTLAFQDTWLAQIKRRGEKLIMYGDDTWLKLFPGMFSRADGTTSFFVSDFTEVDTNVTRHIPHELLQDDWSALIMHYLGLDHIGHKAGPQSPYMITKQREMDAIVSQVYEAMNQEAHLESTLFVVCGDHGMNDAGNHGGSSVGETSPALLFISPKFQTIEGMRQSPIAAFKDMQYYRVVDQTDITPTLAGLLGLPIPLNSLGVFIPELLDLWHSGSQRIQLLIENSKQLLDTVKEAYPGFSVDRDAMEAGCNSKSQTSVEETRCAWFHAQELLRQFDADNGSASQSEVESSLLHFLKTSQSLMSSAASNYNLKYLSLGIFVSGLAVLFALPASYRVLSGEKHAGLFFALSILSYGALMFASSYVEEEQQFWYWIFTGWAFYLHIRSSRRLTERHSKGRGTYGALATLFPKFSPVILAVSHRILRRWNQTGQKFAADPDISRTFFPNHPGSLWVLVALSYADISLHIIGHTSSSMAWRLLCFGVTTLAFTFKLVFAASESPELISKPVLHNVTVLLNQVPLLLYARLVLGGIMLLVVFSTISARQNKRPTKQRVSPSAVFHEALALFLMTQSRVTNVPLFLILRVQLKALASMDLSPNEVTVTSLFMQYITFFAFGGSNAISSVDLSNAYNGVGNYNIVLVGILTFAGNWAGPIWWVSATKLLRSSQSGDEKRSHFTLLTFSTAATLLSVMAACTALRTHLFIWTVFSPKYLYTISWAIIHHFGVNLLWEIF
ncbi:hypothetical protein ARAM_003137 [Aspergillus rambellii]|uniref:GPI ethanolamine phosphate transferase 2 n=2 Tax=Aspergillus subgen. Nidulantes TaxID=2720870 RepID=A0A0F8VPG9_9EURO|nr:hypothetical protein ARAM_003137 [Aspergillus rambellii]KKK26027.1 hypothetical protein AOCH_000494 [Aspergillus ochraceoroseus]